jgi:hypothetical protein
MDGGVVFDGGQEEHDLTAYRKRMREKILSGSEATIMKIIEDYAQSPEFLHLREETADTPQKHKPRRDDGLQR